MKVDALRNRSYLKGTECSVTVGEGLWISGKQCYIWARMSSRVSTCRAEPVLLNGHYFCACCANSLAVAFMTHGMFLVCSGEFARATSPLFHMWMRRLAAFLVPWMLCSWLAAPSLCLLQIMVSISKCLGEGSF